MSHVFSVDLSSRTFMRRLSSVMMLAFAVIILPRTQPSQAADGLPRANPVEVGLKKPALDQVDALFQDYFSRKQIAGAVVLVARHGKVAYLSAIGNQDAESAAPMNPGTIFRIASMTKPITSAAVMILADEGRIDLSDPVSRFLPEFKFMRVAPSAATADANGQPPNASSDRALVSAYRPITIRDLLNHTSGLSYRFLNHPRLGALYADAGICDGLAPCNHSLAENVRRLAALPLAHQPGTAWEYGLSTDVLGRLIEVVSGKSLDEFFRERIFNPLDMPDTHFLLPGVKRSRLATLCEPGADGQITRTGKGRTIKGALIYSADVAGESDSGSGYFSGGAGLVSTARDYVRFLQMLLNRGELDGARILRPETVDAMTRSQTTGMPLGIPVHGGQFGFGFGIAGAPTDANKDPAGTYSWGGAYYTDFWVDPRHELIGVMMTQIYPSGHLKLREELHRLVREAIEP
jgi:CubicO group peptidase (beta-lactamase class C family)